MQSLTHANRSGENCSSEATEGGQCTNGGSSRTGSPPLPRKAMGLKGDFGPDFPNLLMLAVLSDPFDVKDWLSSTEVLLMVESEKLWRETESEPL